MSEAASTRVNMYAVRHQREERAGTVGRERESDKEGENEDALISVSEESVIEQKASCQRV